MRFKPGFAFLLMMGLSCSSKKLFVNSEAHVRLPDKEKLYIFLMAGQSNMAGRALIEAIDTVTDNRVITINEKMQWKIAREPIHFYEKVSNLDCGLSFGKYLAANLDEGITVALIPCAVGGSSLEQWLSDSTHRGVKLYSNFLEKAAYAARYGQIKGILWHQGETNATKQKYPGYESKLKQLFSNMRHDLKSKNVPIFTGEIGSFVNRKPYSDSINQVIRKMPVHLNNVFVIETNDLLHKGDTLHFNSASQRLMGQRFGIKYLQLLYHSNSL